MTTVSSTPSPPIITAPKQPVSPSPAGQPPPAPGDTGSPNTGEVGGASTVDTGAYPAAGAPNVCAFPDTCSAPNSEVSDPTTPGQSSEVSEPSTEERPNRSSEVSVGGDVRVRTETNNGQTTTDTNLRGGVFYQNESSENAVPGRTRRYDSLSASATVEINRREQSGSPTAPGSTGTSRDDATLRGQVIYTTGEQTGVVPGSTGPTTRRDLETFLDGNGGRQ